MVHFPFYRDRTAGALVRRQFDSIIATLRRDQDIGAVASRLHLELVLADEFRDFEDMFVAELRRARDDTGGA